MKFQKLKLLCVCSKNQWRSPTAERIYRNDNRIEVRSSGTSKKAKHRISIKDIEWADLIMCMEKKHKQQVDRIFNSSKLPPIIVLDIEDKYKFMDKNLISLLELKIENILSNV